MTRRRNISSSSENNDCAASDTEEKFGFQSGSDFTLKTFQEFADDFKEQYFGMRDISENFVDGEEHPVKGWQPSVEDIEGEYWRMVEKPTEEVHYGADLETGVLAVAFLKHLPSTDQNTGSVPDVRSPVAPNSDFPIGPSNNVNSSNQCLLKQKANDRSCFDLYTDKVPTVNRDRWLGEVAVGNAPLLMAIWMLQRRARLFLRESAVRLYYLDARKILVTNVGPIGCTPYMRERSSQSSTKCFDFANQVTEYLNRRLMDLVLELSSTLDISIFVYANVYNIVSNIIQNYRKYGFDIADLSWCRFAGRYGGLIPCNLKSKLCSDGTKKKDAEQSAAKIAIEKLGIQSMTHNLTPQEALDELVARVSGLFTDEFLSSPHPLTRHFKVALKKLDGCFGRIPISVIAAYEVKVGNLCKVINPDVDSDPLLFISLIMKAAEMSGSLISINREPWISRKGPYSPEHWLSEPLFTVKCLDSPDHVANREHERRSTFQCEVTVLSRRGDPIIECSVEGTFRKEVDSIQTAALKVLIDFGCGSGSLLDSLLEHSTTLEKIVGVDISVKGLTRAAKILHSKLSVNSSNIQSAILYDGSITEFDSRLCGFDIGTCLEVIEHMEEHQAHLFGDVALSLFRPRVLIVSTPNYEYNSILQRSSLPSKEDDPDDKSVPCRFRNFDHKFEWTREQFEHWARSLASRHNYSVVFSGVGGSGDIEPGFASQIAVFRITINVDGKCLVGEDFCHPYNVIWEWSHKN
ncbi:hypothetical protein J5N97_017718 [Dioscorea zingiberensis]|uniref:Small RNA 2'-O-methyltransferase n=1 Tax=Dioscorea zingiberensis TaxID=325984 RepID=A0A9D5HGU8_9LILI|nr:hypothetical protein J5N97_017718 [Dioscorea zingiberensis]